MCFVFLISRNFFSFSVVCVSDPLFLYLYSLLHSFSLYFYLSSFHKSLYFPLSFLTLSPQPLLSRRVKRCRDCDKILVKPSLDSLDFQRRHVFAQFFPIFSVYKWTPAEEQGMLPSSSPPLSLSLSNTTHSLEHSFTLSTLFFFRWEKYCGNPHYQPRGGRNQDLCRSTFKRKRISDIL